MKTLIIYNQIDQPLSFLLMEGDYTRFNGACINSTIGNGTEGEFVEFMYNPENGETKHTLTEDQSLLDNKEWDRVAIVTWLP